MSDHYKSVVLCILDGWGINPDSQYNAIKQAKTPSWNFFLQNFPHTELLTSGEAVGLPHGQMGNSEVGHMTIGSGRIILQDLLRINQSIKNESLTQHPSLLKLIKDHQKSKKAIHLLGLCSDGGVHSHINHLLFLAKYLSENELKVRLHLFLDGRDVTPSSAAEYLNQIDNLTTSSRNIEIASISGRFYAMDRDNRWERTELAYKAIAEASAPKFSNWQKYLEHQYKNNISDEFAIPGIMENYHGIEENDSILFFNFRSDRIRQLAKSILFSKFDHFKSKALKLKHKIGMTHYSNELSKTLTVLFPEQKITNNLGEILSLNNKRQLRLAETEKYAHVTFFFNGGMEENYPGEDRILVPSPNVRTYDLQPEMSSHQVTDELVKAIKSGKYDLIVVNYANADMVGHSGKMDAAIKAVEAIDHCLEKIYQATKETESLLLISSDHGNIESMFNQENNTYHTSHTTNPVPLIIIANELFQKKLSLPKGDLSDIAPTILDAMNINKPNEMTGKSMLAKEDNKTASFFENVMSILWALLIALLIRTIIFEPYSIPSGSMKPNFLVGDYLFVSKFQYGLSNTSILFEPNLIKKRILEFKQPERGEVIVFKPEHKHYNGLSDRILGINYIKRLIGLPGDEIQVKEGIVYINGKMLERKRAGTFTDTDGSVLKKYIETMPNGVSYEILEESDDNPWDNTGIYKVPAGHYFFMGDNRDHSIDSRFTSGPIGFVPYDKLVGRAEMIVFSNKESIINISRFPFSFIPGRFFIMVK